MTSASWDNADLSMAASSLLLPLATITGHGGMYAGSFTSAALMKIKAAAALAALAKLTESGFHFKIGHGWAPSEHEHNIFHDNSMNLKHSHHHRKRRDVVEGLEEPSFEDVAAVDTEGCGMRLVCELAAMDKSALSQDAEVILSLFGFSDLKQSKSKQTYTQATLLGANSQDRSICAKVYSRCVHSAETILEAIRS